jgi:hypothetical protein
MSSQPHLQSLQPRQLKEPGLRWLQMEVRVDLQVAVVLEDLGADFAAVVKLA